MAWAAASAAGARSVRRWRGIRPARLTIAYGRATLMDRDLPRPPSDAHPGPEHQGPRPLDLVGWVRRRHGPGRTVTSRSTPGPSRPADRTRLRLRRAARYLERIPGAVSGRRGHDRTFHAACVLIKGFGLSTDEARTLLREWNQGASPPGRSGSSTTSCRVRRPHPTRDPGVPRRCRAIPRGLLERGGRRAGGSSPARVAIPTSVAHASRRCPRHVPEGRETNPHRLAGSSWTSTFPPRRSSA